MKIAVIDADLIGRKRHRFPNLACEKISGFYRDRGVDVVLKTDYEGLDQFDEVFVSKVFTDTPVPKNLTGNIHFGGTGFYFDKAPNLPDQIEHCFPDYTLYDTWIKDQLFDGSPRNEFKEYIDYSMGYLTRGCFRKCKFCVNQKYDRVIPHSPLEEFYFSECKKICLLDDNFFGYRGWKPLLQQLIDTGKPFKFKQGMDERILTDEKCEMLFSANYDGDFTFAFDNYSDRELIVQKIDMIRRWTDDKHIMFYVLCGFTDTGLNDIVSVFERIRLLIDHQMLPYIMRYQSATDAPWKTSEFRGMYVTLARWCNQPSIFKKNSFRQYCRDVKTNGEGGSAYRYMEDFEKKFPSVAAKYFDMKWGD